MTATNSFLSFGCLGKARTGACLLLALATSHPAYAQSNAADSDRANLLFKKGKAAFNDGKYADALRIYGEAWQLKQSPDIAANLAQTESELGKHREAAEHFAFALAHLLPSTTDDQKRALADGLEVEKREVGTLHVTLEPADSELSIDDAPVTLPPSGDLFVEPGAHRCSVTHPGYEANQQAAQVSKGSSQVLWIRLVPAGGAAAPAPLGTGASARTPDSAPPTLNQSSRRSLVPAFVGGGVAVLGVAAGIGFMLSGNSHSDKAGDLAKGIPGQNGCGAGTPYASECAALHDENQSRASARTLETVSFAVAGAAVVGTFVYLLWPQESDRSSGCATGFVTLSSLRPTLQLARGAETVGVSARF